MTGWEFLTVLEFILNDLLEVRGHVRVYAE